MQALEPSPLPLHVDRDGVIRFVGTRVGLEVVVTAFDAGATPEEITQQYPSLDLAAVYGAIAYMLDHRSFVDDYMSRRRAVASSVRTDIERVCALGDFRRRLLARRATDASP